jgi:hypothetical protein
VSAPAFLDQRTRGVTPGAYRRRMITRSRFRVRILYREPTYELVRGFARDPYSWTHELEAASLDRAREEALSVFSRAGADSNVGWVREVVRVDVEVLAQSPEPFD